MLVLSRKEGERIVVDGRCEISVVRMSRGKVRLGIQAEPGVKILRCELAAQPAGEHVVAELPAAIVPTEVADAA